MTASHALLASGLVFGIWAWTFYQLGIREGIRKERQRRARQFFGRRPPPVTAPPNRRARR
jgi:hypothetical protein